MTRFSKAKQTHATKNSLDEKEHEKLTRKEVKAAFVYALKRLDGDNENSEQKEAAI